LFCCLDVRTNILPITLPIDLLDIQITGSKMMTVLFRLPAIFVISLSIASSNWGFCSSQWYIGWWAREAVWAQIRMCEGTWNLAGAYVTARHVLPQDAPKVRTRTIGLICQKEITNILQNRWKLMLG
jgi:hypothetical protein